MDTLIIFASKYFLAVPVFLTLMTFFRAPRERRKEILLFGVILLPLAYVIALISRASWFDPRPFVVGNFTPLIPHAADNGFPSDHVLLAAALAAFIGYTDKKIASIAWLIAIAIGVARVAAGIHHTADIIGSIVIVLATKWMARVIIGRLWKKPQINSSSQ
jgi:undecaprenyl-diphosphatase